MGQPPKQATLLSSRLLELKLPLPRHASSEREHPPKQEPLLPSRTLRPNVLLLKHVVSLLSHRPKPKSKLPSRALRSKLPLLKEKDPKLSLLPKRKSLLPKRMLRCVWLPPQQKSLPLRRVSINSLLSAKHLVLILSHTPKPESSLSRGELTGWCYIG